MKLADHFQYQADFLGHALAQRLLDKLWCELDWRQYKIRLFGREVSQPRLTAWCCDETLFYTYSGLTLRASPWHPELEKMRDRLQARLRCRFNSVLVNAYRDGRDSMGWHADDEPELGPRPLIASVSLGATRRMLIRPSEGGSSTGLDLAGGSLLIMHKGSQAIWQHSVPRTAKPVGLRINLTFRRILEGAGRERL